MVFILLSLLYTFLYLRIARKYEIEDIPNQRSSHQYHTIRGAGLIFIPILLSTIPILGADQFVLIAALCIGGLTGFADDLLDMKRRYRLMLYALAVALAIVAAGLLQKDISWYISILAFIITLGTVNTYNFMDGINGISLLYALVLVLSLWFFQVELQLELLQEPVFYGLVTSIFILCYLNVRKRAKAFIGDAGSIFLGIFSAFAILGLINETNNPVYIILLAVYGVDSVGTILLRLTRKENIFSAHRLHMYQMLANEKGYGHLSVSASYAFVQLLINTILILSIRSARFDTFILLPLTLGILVMVYVILRVYLIRDFSFTKSNA